MDTSRERIAYVFQTLMIEDSVCARTVQVLEDIWNVVTSDTISDKLQQSEETKYRIGICLLYTVSIDAQYPYGIDDPSGHEIQHSFTVTELLQCAKINIIDFFNSMRSLRELHPVSKSVMAHLLAMEKKFLITLPLYHKFESMATDIFQREDKLRLTEVQECSDERTLVWSLFVYVKEISMPGYRELFESFQLLLCCLDTVLQDTPAFKLKPPFDSVKMEASERPNEPCMLQALCDAYHSSIAQISKVEKIKTNCLEPVVKMLKERDAFDVNTIGDKYSELYKQAGDINELLFLRNDAHLTVSLPSDTKNKPDGAESTHGSAVKMTPPCTPVRSAMNAVQSLLNLVSTTVPEPSPTLLAVFQNCSVDPTQILLARVSTMRQTFIENYSKILCEKCNALNPGKLANDMASERIDIAIKLFYKQLETLLKLEEEKLSQKDFSHLLNNTTFTVCLLACSIQVVLSTFTQNLGASMQYPASENRDDAAFPWILDVFEIQAFDFFKVIDSFVRAEPNLPQDVVKHLQTLENKIVEKLAWKRNSPLFTSLDRCQVPPPTVLQTPPAGSKPDIKISSAPHLYLSPMRPFGNIQTPATPTRDVTVDSPCKQACKSHSLSLFLNRVCKLAYQRLQRMCSLLNIAKELRNKIWTCLEYCVTRRPELLQNRHLDQIVMCSIYAICKITDKEIKFKNIVSSYRHFPHYCQEVYKNIEISSGEEDSIISFYNRVFMQKMKSYLVQFCPAATPNKVSPLTHSPLTRAPMSPMTRQLQASPVVTLPGRSNFFISPLTDSPFKVPMSPGQLTPRSKQTFSFGEGPASSEKLKAINAAIRSPPGGTPRSQKRLKFDAPENSHIGESETDVIVVRRVASSPAAKAFSFSSAGSEKS